MRTACLSASDPWLARLLTVIVDATSRTALCSRHASSCEEVIIVISDVRATLQVMALVGAIGRAAGPVGAL